MLRSLLSILFLSATMSHPAKADQPEINAEMRFDYVQSKNEPKSEENSRESYFANIYPRVEFNGEINDKTSYVIRYNFYQSEGPSADTYITTRDQTASNLEYFYINHELSDSISFKAGKIFAFAGSQEWNYSEIDNYYYSRIASHIPLFYQTGLELGYGMADQWFGVQVLNGPVGEAKQKEKDFAKALAYYGSFAEGTVKPIITYSLYPRQSTTIEGQTTDQTTDIQWGVGSRIELSQFEIDIEYGSFVQAAYTTTDDNGGAIDQAKLEWRSVMALLRWRSETLGLAPFVKASIEHRYVDNDHSNKYLDYAFGSEFSPDDSILRYHAVYIKRNDEDLLTTNQSDSSTTSQELRIGTTLKF